MQDRKRTRSIYRITLAGSFTNFLLVTFKFIAGFMGHSAAMIADAVHSLSDFITDAVVLVCVHLANKPSDKGHDYGHEKYETIATAIIGTGLLIVGTGICWSGVVSVWNVLHGGDIEAPGIIALWMALLSVTLKELIFHITLYVGKKADSQIVIANAWHHRSDALSSVTTALGIGGAIFLGEYSSEPLGDYFAGPNHVLPTNGTAKFFSPLSVDDFIKKSSVISYSKEALKEVHEDIIRFAKAEHLTAHANSIAVRFGKEVLDED